VEQLWTVLATGAVSLAAVAVQRIFEARADKRRMDAERANALETREREDRVRREQENAQRMELRRAQGEAVLVAFAGALEGMSQYGDRATPEAMEAAWVETYEPKVRVYMERVHSDSTREDMYLVAGVLADFENYTRVNNLSREFGGYGARTLVQLLVELAGAYNRGEEFYSGKLERNLNRVRERVQAVTAWFDSLAS